MPTSPPLVTTKFVAVEEPIANDGPLMPFGLTERSAQGDEEACPTNPAFVMVSAAGVEVA